MSAPVASSAFINEVVGKRTSAYANLAGFALLVYDYCITVHHEVHWLWGEKWTWGRVVFTVARYFPFPGLALTIVGAFEAVSFKPCNQPGISTYIHLISILAAEGLLMMRTWAFWDCSRRLLIILLVIAAIFVGLAIGLTEYVNGILPKLDPPTGTPPGTCSFSTGQGSAIQYGFLVVYELMLLTLTIWRWVTHHRSTQSRLINAVYRDTVVYVFCMIALSLANILNTVISPAYHNEYFDSLQLATHSVLSSRIFFHIRESTEEIRARALPSHMSTFRVATPVIRRNDIHGYDVESMIDDVIVIE